MPLLDSFKVDHTKMNAPAVRVAKTMRTPKGDDITIFDLRFCIPNKEILPPKGIHTLEHLFAGFMRDHLNNEDVEIIDISPMGCRTGFYMSHHPTLRVYRHGVQLVVLGHFHSDPLQLLLRLIVVVQLLLLYQVPPIPIASLLLH